LSEKERRYLNDTQKARLANERRTGEPNGQPFNTYDYFFKPEERMRRFEENIGDRLLDDTYSASPRASSITSAPESSRSSSNSEDNNSTKMIRANTDFTKFIKIEYDGIDVKTSNESLSSLIQVKDSELEESAETYETLKHEYPTLYKCINHVDELINCTIKGERTKTPLETIVRNSSNGVEKYDVYKITNRVFRGNRYALISPIDGTVLLKDQKEYNTMKQDQNFKKIGGKFRFTVGFKFKTYKKNKKQKKRKTKRSHQKRRRYTRKRF
jgi:hypothetical protein